MKLNYKVKAALGSLIVLVLVATGFFYVKNRKSSLAEIQLADQTESDAFVSQLAEESQPEAGVSVSTENKIGDKTVSPEASKKTEDIPQKTDSKNDSLKIIDRLVSFGFQVSAGRSIDTIIIHSTYDALGKDPHSVAGVIAEYKSYGVSPHYLIDREGNVYQLVRDQGIAYHAGVSRTPDGRTNVNDFSLGVELIENNTESPSAAQYASLKNLLSELKGEYKIKYILGHNQIALGRKTDPWNFDWGKIK